MLAEDPSLRARAQEAAVYVERVVADVNELGPETQRAELAALAPELLEKIRPDVGPKELPPLPDAVDGKVVLRLAPYPSGPLHIGNARAFVLNDAYTKRYHGKLLLVVALPECVIQEEGDRKSTRLNSTPLAYLVCPLLLEKKKKANQWNQAHAH